MLNHRMAKKAEFSKLQKYMGRELMRDETGVVPDIHQNWLAPLWLIKILEAGAFNSSQRSTLSNCMQRSRRCWGYLCLLRM